MENKLIIVEGIPGSGKTTIARKIKEKLLSEGKKVVLYEEGMSHPADMSWQAYLSEDEYTTFLKRCIHMWETTDKVIGKEELLSRIDKQTRKEDDHVLLAYTRIEFPQDCYWNLIGEVAAKEICDGRRSIEEFKNIHLRRWTRFAENALTEDTIYIFECAFLQNHIFELLGVYEKSDEEIYTYLRDLIETVKGLSPKIVYMEPNDVEKIIDAAALVRKAPNSSRKDWIDEIADWVSNTNYGKSHNLHCREGVISFCQERLRIDKLMISKLDIPVTIYKR